MAAKVFKTLEEQINILKDKGLKIEDEETTKLILLRENYFFIMGYRSVFLKTDGSKKFINGTTFNELYSVFVFDRMFRNIIFKNLLIFENNYKSIFSYMISMNYGYKEKEYLSTDNFVQDKSRISQINDVIRKVKRQLRVNGRQHQATSHYLMNYGYIPMWIGIKVISFGLMGEMFSILKREDQEKLALYFDVTADNLEIYLPILANYRNLCAHEDILFNHFTQKLIDDTKYHELLYIKKIDNEYVCGKNDIFALIIMLKQLMSKDDFQMMMKEVIYEAEILEGKLKSIKIDAVLECMGFPENYKDLMYI
ncbi:MAG: Abi family protein [Bacilli bacterium]